MSLAYSSPMTWFLSCLIVVVLYGVTSVSGDCAPVPITVPLANVTLSNNNVARGLNISVGSPQQPFAFLPQWPLNNSFVYGTNGYCPTGYSSSACTTYRGGAYNELVSSTRGLAAANSYPDDTGTYPNCDWITDNITLNHNVTLGDYAIGIALQDWQEQGYSPQIAMGLGSNSTILNALVSAGQIASRSWAMFWGRTGGTSDTQLDGNFVFGGYDRAKTTGANLTSSLTTGTSCVTDMIVTITDLVLNFPNGTDVSLLGSSQAAAIRACIHPDYPVLMSIPYTPYFMEFEELVEGGLTLTGRSFGLYYYGMLYDSPEQGTPYNGDLTIQINSALTVRVPNDQLVVPNLVLDQPSGAWVANGSAPELLWNSEQQVNANDLPQLGRQFLSAAYLMLNQDSNEFTLWAANPTSAEDVVAVDSHNNVVDKFCAATPSATVTASAIGATHTGASTATGPTASRPASGSGGGSSISTGAIVGIAIGAVAAVAGFAFLMWLLFKKKKNVQDRNYMSEVPPAALEEDSWRRKELDGRNVFIKGTPVELPYMREPTELMSSSPRYNIIRQELPG